MPATTPFISGDGPVVPGTVWPFVCIVIMCGALSGFHALVSSSTTPKMIDRESDIRIVGYGGMLVEGFVSIMALIAACSLEPGDYFKINVNVAKHARMVEMAKAKYGLDLRPKEFDALQASTGKEQLAGKTAGAVTLAAGMAKIFSQPARHGQAKLLLLPLHHHVRGPLHPHAVGDRHAGLPLHLRGGGPAVPAAAGPPAGPTGCSTSPPARWSASCGDTCSTRAASKTSGA